MERQQFVSDLLIQISKLEDKLAESWQPDVKTFYEQLYRGQSVESILGAVAHWNISIGKALELLRNILLEQPLSYPMEDNLQIYDPENWDTVIVDVVPENWDEKTEYGISGLNAGDQIIVVRKRKKFIED